MSCRPHSSVDDLAGGAVLRIVHTQPILVMLPTGGLKGKYNSDCEDETQEEVEDRRGSN